MKNDYIAIMVTCPSGAEAKRIVDSLLRKRLVACANVIASVESRFWWKGKIDSAREVLVIMKTRPRHFAAIAREVRRLHSYDVPEVVALPISRGSKDYLGWIRKTVG